jgi:hypothetical protein
VATEDHRRSWLATRRGRIFLGVCVLALAAAIAVSLATTGSKKQAAEGARMGPAPARSADALARPGERVNVAVELDATTGGVLRGRFLQPAGENAFRRTDRPVEVRWAPGQGVLMGSSGDIRPGAVLQVAGRVGASGRVEARQLVVLTGYVEVQ